MWTNPSTSWLVSLNPIPRSIPDSKKEADRPMLNVATHWYAFHVLIIRLVCVSGVSTCMVETRSRQCDRRRASPSSTASGLSQRSITGSTPFLLMVWPSGGSNFWSRGFSQ